MVLAGIMPVCVAVTASGAAMLADLNAVLRLTTIFIKQFV